MAAQISFEYVKRKMLRGFSSFRCVLNSQKYKWNNYGIFISIECKNLRHFLLNCEVRKEKVGKYILKYYNAHEM